VAPFPAVVVLWNSRVHVSTSDGGNVITVIERVINEKFCFGSILRVPYEIDLKRSICQIALVMCH